MALVERRPIGLSQESSGKLADFSAMTVGDEDGHKRAHVMCQ